MGSDPFQPDLFKKMQLSGPYDPSRESRQTGRILSHNREGLVYADLLIITNRRGEFFALIPNQDHYFANMEEVEVTMYQNDNLWEVVKVEVVSGENKGQLLVNRLPEPVAATT